MPSSTSSARSASPEKQSNTGNHRSIVHSCCLLERRFLEKDQILDDYAASRLMPKQFYKLTVYPFMMPQAHSQQPPMQQEQQQPWQIQQARSPLQAEQIRQQEEEEPRDPGLRIDHQQEPHVSQRLSFKCPAKCPEVSSNKKCCKKICQEQASEAIHLVCYKNTLHLARKGSQNYDKNRYFRELFCNNFGQDGSSSHLLCGNIG